MKTNDVTPIKIDSPPGMGRSLIHHDPRSRAFRATELVWREMSEVVEKTWRRGQAYDQGMTSTCVAQTGKGILNSSPMSARVDYDIRSEYSISEFYGGAQQNDEWPGENYDGTSGLGLCKYLHGLGLIKEYQWCFSLQDVLLTLSHVGPVGLGVWWYSGMMSPTADGTIRPTGVREGGHEVELMGVDPSDKVVIGMNSWGTSWGDRGRFRMSYDDLEQLLGEQGDAFVIVQ